MKLVVGISGASGSIYGIELLRSCIELGIETHLIITPWAEQTITRETVYSVEDVVSLASSSYSCNDLAAPPASGSFIHEGMAIVPCSMKTLAAIACGISANLLQRSADVTLKEGRKLVICPRETPLSAIHLENMLKLARLGVVILPPMPAMYVKPGSIQEIVAFTISRLLDQFKIEHDNPGRWGVHL